MGQNIKIQYKLKKPVKAAQHCLLHKCMKEHILQITQEGRYYKGNHGHHIVFGILQFHPAKGNEFYLILTRMNLNKFQSVKD